MTADQVKELLPIIEAFANRRFIKVRRPGLSLEWAHLNPDTTEFRFSDLTDPEIEWSLVEENE
jgi:hypothetical protein